MKIFGFFLITFFAFTAHAQNYQRDLVLKQGGTVEITNLFGRVDAAAEDAVEASETTEPETNIIAAGKVSLSVTSNKQISESDIKIDNTGGRIKIEIIPADPKTRVDLTVKMPSRSRVKIETTAGEVRVAGNLEAAEIRTETGTIAANVPLENLKYDFVWTESRPRFLSDVELEKVEEKAAGKFVINGKIVGEEDEKRRKGEEETETEDNSENAQDVTEGEQKTEEVNGQSKDKKAKKKNKGQRTKDKGQIKLNFTTARGIVLLNVNPNEVPSNLRERPLTEAAKAAVRSGDSLLTEAIRRASPKYFGDYAKTLPPRKKEPS